LKEGDYLQVGRLIFKLKLLANKPSDTSENRGQFSKDKVELILSEDYHSKSDYDEFSKKYDKSVEVENQNSSELNPDVEFPADSKLAQDGQLNKARVTDMIPRAIINSGIDPLIGGALGGCSILQIMNVTPSWRDYVAKDLSKNNLVVLRIMSTEFSSSQNFIKQFKREAVVSASLRHPNILRIKTAGRDNQYYYFTRDYVEVSKLDVMIATEGVLKSNSVISIGIQLSSALAFAHQHNIIHRNINPSNILIDSSGNPLITDFGFASMIDRPGTGSTITKMGDITTLLYKSPEMLDKIPQATELSDIYSLCAVLYFSLSGSSPFLMLTDVFSGNPQKLEDIIKAVDSRLSKLIHKGLSKNPRNRFASADELIQELKKL
jgi:serine/threonine-protein kinase